MRRLGAWLVASCLLAPARPDVALAHPLGFGVLELDVADREHARFVLRLSPDEGSAAGAVGLHWPAGCEATEEVAREPGGIEVRRGEVHCESGLFGSLEVTGLSGETSVLLRIHRGASAELLRLDARTPSAELGARPSTTFASFFELGAHHALEGVDHLLFLLGLVMLARERLRIVAAVTAFTVGHAATLALASLDVVSADVPTVELLIALSLVALAVELTRAREISPPLGARHPVIFSGAFGLLHGLGFATALGATGLPRAERALPLVGFHLGIELAQLAVIGVALVALWLVRERRPSVELGAAYVVGALGAAMCFIRW